MPIDISLPKINNFPTNIKRLKVRYAGRLLLFTLINNNIYILMGVDKKYNEYTIPGGMCGQNEPTLNCMIREVKEETKNIIEMPIAENCKVLRYNYPYRFVFKNDSVYNFIYSNLLYIAKSNINNITDLKVFNARFNSQKHLVGTKYDEMSKLRWISLDKLLKILNIETKIVIDPYTKYGLTKGLLKKGYKITSNETLVKSLEHYLLNINTCEYTPNILK